MLVPLGPTDAHASIAVGEGTSMAAIGEKTVVLVRTKDKRGNDRATGGDYVHATLTQRSTNSVVHAKVRDTGDGTYQVSYVLTISALPHDYLMAIRVNNASIGGSPSACARAPARPCASRRSRSRCRDASRHRLGGANLQRTGWATSARAAATSSRRHLSCSTAPPAPLRTFLRRPHRRPRRQRERPGA